MIGLVGAGYMGSGLAVSLIRGGHQVATTLAGRSARTRGLVERAGIGVVPDLVALVSSAEIVLVVTPPDAAIDAAQDIAAAAATAGSRPVVVDLNAIAPSTVARIGEILAGAGLDLVDGAISGAPPTTTPGTQVFLSGPRAAEIAALHWHDVVPIVVDGPIGQASAVKMSTASIHKGVAAIVTQALRAADHYGVLDTVIAALGPRYADPEIVVTAAAKSDRYVGEMHEIAAAQQAAGLTPALFSALAEVYASVATTPLAAGRPEDVVDDARPLADVIADLRPR
jgi:3-hydroxyisobutyrate dehydrogenase-like beta-hydroxyacid dehydrogenase